MPDFTSTAHTDLDMWARGVPYDEFARLRRECPVAWPVPQPLGKQLRELGRKVLKSPHTEDIRSRKAGSTELADLAKTTV